MIVLGIIGNIAVLLLLGIGRKINKHYFKKDNE